MPEPTKMPPMDVRNRVLDGGGSRSPWEGLILRLNRSICRLGCGLGWAEGSTSSIAFTRWSQRSLMQGLIGTTWWMRLNCLSEAAIWPCVRLLCLLVSDCNDVVGAVCNWNVCNGSQHARTDCSFHKHAQVWRPGFPLCEFFVLHLPRDFFSVINASMLRVNNYFTQNVPDVSITDIFLDVYAVSSVVFFVFYCQNAISCCDW